MTTTKATRRAGLAPLTQCKTIFLVDDHALIRRGLAELINEQPDLEVCGEASTASEALEQIRDKMPDLAVIDLALEEGSGLELIKDIRYTNQAIRLIVASMHDEVIFAERVMKAGAQGYINKSEPAERFIDAIRTVLKGNISLSGRLSERIMRRAIGQGRGEHAASPLDTLTDRELQVLEMIGQGKKTRDIAGQLHLSVKTIDTYREHLKVKLSLKSGNELVHYAVAWGLEKVSPTDKIT